MKQNKDWTDVMRSALRDAEVTPPADGWARLERELKTPAPRISVLRRYWPRIAAAAAAVLIFVGGGELLLHENRSLGIKGLLRIGNRRRRPPRTIGHIRPGDAAELRESLRAVVPSQEAVRAESLPGREAQARQAVRAAYPATAVARNAAPTVVAVDVTDSRPQPVPENEAAATLRSEETIAQKQAAAETSGVQERTAPKENAASARTYPSTTSYYGDQIAFEQPKSRQADFRVALCGRQRDGRGNRVGGARPRHDDVRRSGRWRRRHDGPAEIQLRRLFLQTSPAAQFRTLGAQGIRARSVARKRRQLHAALGRRPHEVQPAGYQSETPFYRRAAAYELAVSGYGALLAYAGAGGVIEKRVSAKFGSRAMDEPGVQWSVLGAAGAQYDLGGLVGLYFEPEVSYYFTETDLRTSRTDSPLSLTLRLGVRLSF